MSIKIIQGYFYNVNSKENNFISIFIRAAIPPMSDVKQPFVASWQFIKWSRAFPWRGNVYHEWELPVY